MTSDPISALLDDLQQAQTRIEAHSLVTEYTLLVEQATLDQLVGSAEAAALWKISQPQAYKRLSGLPNARQIGREWVASRNIVAAYVAPRRGPKQKKGT